MERKQQALGPNAAAEKRNILPSAFGGVVRLTNLSSLRYKNSSFTNKPTQSEHKQFDQPHINFYKSDKSSIY
jgi:hypothetical protein